MSFATIDALRESLAQPGPGRTPEYNTKMMHVVPDAPVIDRAKSILQHCAGKRVLEFGASGPMHDAVGKVATLLVGIDRHTTDDVIGFDLDKIGPDLPDLGTFDLILCGEILEHLANPGWFLERLHRQYPGVQVVITVPNAFTANGKQHMRDSIENVNIDHVAWYSYRTLRTLIERYGYAVQDFAWYHGNPLTAEGMIMVVQ